MASYKRQHARRSFYRSLKRMLRANGVDVECFIVFNQSVRGALFLQRNHKTSGRLQKRQPKHSWFWCPHRSPTKTTIRGKLAKPVEQAKRSKRRVLVSMPVSVPVERTAFQREQERAHLEMVRDDRRKNKRSYVNTDYHS